MALPVTLFEYFAAAAVDPAAAATDCKVHHGNGESFESAVSGVVEADTAAAAAAAAAAARVVVSEVLRQDD